MSGTSDNTAGLTTQQNWRIAPSVPIALIVIAAYTIVTIGLQSSSGIPYDQWFDTGGNAVRTAVLPLLAGSAVLVLFVWWARWDFVFRDPARLPMSLALWIAVALVALGIVGHFFGVDWSQVRTDLLLAIIATGVLVGFAEETLFRGIFLRSLRTNNRPEAWVVLISSVTFGFWHLTNLLNGSALGGVVIQCVLASLLGVSLYLFRRFSGLLVVGMIAHGVWDISVFLPITDVGTVVNLGIQLLVVISALIALILLIVRERRVTVTPGGVVDLPKA